MRKSFPLGWLVGSMLLLAGSLAAAEPSYVALTSDLDQLRADFNADLGKVRAVLLAAPT